MQSYLQLNYDSPFELVTWTAPGVIVTNPRLVITLENQGDDTYTATFELYDGVSLVHSETLGPQDNFEFQNQPWSVIGGCMTPVRFYCDLTSNGTVETTMDDFFAEWIE